jgi:hypothetical protein
MWPIKGQEGLGRRFKDFQKKWPHELKNVFDNLDTLHEALCNGARPEQLKKLGFVRSEPSGILAIDQKGPGKKAKLKALRLYVFADVTDEVLHVIELGDKDSQRDDLRNSIAFVRRLEQLRVRERSREGATG